MRITKFVGLLAVTLPLLTMTLFTGFSEDAFAVNTGTVDDGAGDHRIGSGTENSMPGTGISTTEGNGGKRFGATMKYIVCGDRLCSEPAAEVEAKAATEEGKLALEGPFFKILGIQKASANSENLYKVIFDVYAGEGNPLDIQLLVTSDKESTIAMAGSLNAGSHAVTIVKIQADDPGSIDAKVLDWGINIGSENHLRP